MGKAKLLQKREQGRVLAAVFVEDLNKLPTLAYAHYIAPGCS